MVKFREFKEAWLSGRKQHTANVLTGKPVRRFESFRLRQLGNEGALAPSFILSL